jgi:hypothetical protein
LVTLTPSSSSEDPIKIAPSTHQIKKKRELLNCFYRIPPTFVELLQLSFLAMLTGIAQEDLRAYVGASGAKLAQYLPERKIFRIKVAENNKTRILTAYHFFP